jgi:putative (di)nucleoside polyphosphate hydrolase
VDLDLYRPNVGVVVFNGEGRVWLGKRAGWSGPHTWQFPQGGVDPGEDWEAAARRELQEETGIRSVALLGRTEDWIVYDFPAEARGAKVARGYQGQKQKWFAFRFTGEESEIDLEGHHQIEFEAWRWARLGEVSDLVVPFKRRAYETVVEAFRAFAP